MTAIYISEEITIISRIRQLLSKIHYRLLKDNRPVNTNNLKESILHLRNRSRVFVSETKIEIHNSSYSHNI